MSRAILVGPSAPRFKGGIVLYTYSLYQAYRRRDPSIELVSFSRPYPKRLFPGATSSDTSRVLSRIENERPLIDWLNPLSWLATFFHIRSTGADRVVFPWWTWFWAPAYLVIMTFLKLFSRVKIVIIAHNAFDHEDHPLKRLAARLVLSLGDRYIVNSRAVQSAIEEMFPRKKNRITRLFHPLYDIFHEQRAPERAESLKKLKLSPPLLLFFGHVRKYKGLDILIEAMAAVVKEDPQIKLLVAGEFWEDAGIYRERIQKLHLAKNIVLMDRYVKNEEVPVLFRAADALVLPYRRAVGTGPSKVAIGFDLPIIATPAGDLSELFAVAEIGVMAKQATPPDMAAAIIRFFQGDRQKFVGNVRKVKRELSWEKFVGIIENI